ncbi:hypothetical protein C0039_00240 [Pseudohalioglobus lutimaris]|uniref:SGNH/GDSL hydrolase family protein n=2 Tax=Pseudohalioglobus lutimaris TaxID=1737061 RepID=A0A2N5X7Z9_9GAMM|nr:hypothetical protein C0039_00240 [Pseudohalioglobus lutimaris]
MTAVLVALGSLFLCCLLFLLLVTSRAMATFGDDFLTVSTDDYDLAATTRVLRLQHASALSRSLVILGASTTRSSLLESDLAVTLDSVGLDDVEVVKLCTSAQYLWHSFTMLNSLPMDLRGVVVLGIGPPGFARELDQLEGSIVYRLGLRSLVADDFLRARNVALRRNWGNVYALNNFDFLFTRDRRSAAVKNLITGRSPQLVDNRHLNKPPISVQKRRILGDQVVELLSDYQENYTENFQILEMIRREVDSREGLSLILYEAPVSPWFFKEYGQEALYESFDQAMASYAATHGLLFLQADELASLQESHFSDWAHLSSPEVAKTLSRKVVDAAAPLF